MANYRYTLTANTASFKLCTINKPRTLTYWYATISTYGTFSAGTVAYFISPDGGTTLIPMRDNSGVAYATAVADSVNSSTGMPNVNFPTQQMILYASLTGAGTPNIVIDIADNT